MRPLELFFKISFLAITMLVMQDRALAQEQKIIPYENITTDQPSVGSTANTYLGERMFTQSTGQYIKCITPDFEYRAGLFAKMFILPGKKICAENKGDNYTPQYIATTNEEIYKQSSIFVKVTQNSNGEYKFCFSALCKNKISKNQFVINYEFRNSTDSFQRTLEYLGKSGQSLRFIYSEYISGTARPAFSREFNIDLSDNNMVIYGGAIFEIENASSNSITYKVIRGFSK